MGSLDARFWELDLFRGSAVVLMIIFHAAFDLNYFGIYNISLHSGPWLFLSLITATAFVLAAGISISLSHSRDEIKGLAEDQTKSRLLLRGLWIFSLGLGITLATYLLIGEGFIIFGVLHLLGMSTILAWPFLNLKKINALMGGVIIALGLYLQGLTFSFPWLLWLGLYPEGLYTLDYFPLLPWFGVVLVGIFLGDVLYPGYVRAVEVHDVSGHPQIRLLCLFGRNSLIIYLVHQPILLILLYLSGLTPASAIWL